MPNSGPNNPADLSIVFFDGVCGLCNHTVNVLMSLDRRGVLRFAPLQGEAAQALVPADVREQLNTFVFSDGGRLSYRSTALAGILRRIGGPWWLVGTFLWLIPRPLRDVAYRVVSRLRYRLFGRQESCRLPRPEERARFLDWTGRTALFRTGVCHERRHPSRRLDTRPTSNGATRST